MLRQTFLALSLGLLLPALAHPTAWAAEKAAPWKAGLHERTMRSSDTERQYLVHIPRRFKAGQKETLPLVVMLHGRTSNGRQAASSYYGWTDLADKESFIAVFPTALGTPTSWEGAWYGKPTADSIFLAELIGLLKSELPVDSDRVFMTGHSSGGFMSYSFAATHSDQVAAIGPVAGLVLSKASVTAPVSVVSFHGIADNIVAYDNEHGKNAAFNGMPSAIESAAFFAGQVGCEKEPVRTTIAKGKVFVDTWTQGQGGAEVVLYSIDGGDHGWPKGGAKSVDATKLIWEFFAAHPRRADSDETGADAKLEGKDDSSGDQQDGREDRNEDGKEDGREGDHLSQ